ncbi:peptidase [Synechococcus sp. ATX 2A4]|uniref:peptidase n=1 Tax=Synechococcus sp. ATX 2A4 TaxID=2823727 RepID=UPI0020CD2E81|nr:peptidase [Synechococcus sp. ATX 2A4]
MLRAVAAWLLCSGAPADRVAAAPTSDCPPTQATRPWQPSASTPAQRSDHPAGYSHLLTPSPAGWARLQSWCVWVEPTMAAATADPVEARWQQAVLAALASWGEELVIVPVTDPARAQVLVRRQRPPLRELGGRLRASHGRASLQVLEVQRAGSWRLEPRVEVLISPGQRQLAIQATALHELGHAFGLWGHSDDPADALAAVPGSQPVIALTARDRATLRWLQAQPSRFGQPLPAPAAAQL